MPDRAEGAEQRPPLTPALSGAELQRWYWLTAELISLARTMGISTAGSKQQLTARLVAALDGAAATPLHGSSRVRRADRAPQLSGELTLQSVIPAGQRCSQELRHFLTAQVGPSFRFDAAMREFVATANGRTLADAVDHWWATRQQPRGDIAPQFELNRFLREWYATNPEGKRDEALAAWRTYRSLPVDARGDLGAERS